MEIEQDRTAWQDITGVVLRPAAWGRQSQPLTASSPDAALPAQLQPADDREFITILTPCLQLVAPVGMSEDDRDTWFEAARLALIDVPVDLLQRGAKHAMLHADHPSKIVPLIAREAAAALASRRSASAIWEGADNSPLALPAPGSERPTADELATICKQFGVGRFSKAAPADRREVSPSADPSRPCRVPTREDYLRMGVPAASLDALSEQPGDHA